MSDNGPLATRLAANVKRLREAQRMPILQLVERLTELGRPIGRNALAAIEKGERRVDVDELVALARVLGAASPWDLTAEVCDTCLNAPPRGMRCLACERAGGVGA